MDDVEGLLIRAAILQDTVSDEIWSELVGLADPLLQTIRGTFIGYTTAFDSHDCLGVLHSTFAQVILKIDLYDPSQPLLPWARSIARHLVIDLLRDRTQQLAMALDLRPGSVSNARGSKEGAQREEFTDSKSADQELPSRSKASEPQYTYEYGQDSHLANLPKTRRFQLELERMSDEDQEFIIDHWGNGVPLVDLARRAGITDAAMRKRAERVRKKLYERLVRHPEFTDLQLSRKTLPAD